MAIGEAVPLREAAPKHAVDVVGALKRRREELLKARPWSAGDDRIKKDWNIWAEEVLKHLRADDADEELVALATLSFAELGPFHSPADFSDMVFPSEVSFESVVFSGGANFDRSHFLGRVVFGGRSSDADHVTRVAPSVPAQFHQKSSFIEAIFEKEVVLATAVFNAAVAFDGADFYDAADFSNILFRRSCSFDGCSFMGETLFQSATFNYQGQSSSKVSFDGARFRQCPMFTSALFRGSIAKAILVNFSRLKLADGANFVGVQFGDVSDRGAIRGVDLSFADLECESVLNLTRTRFRADFRGMQKQRFDGPISFDEAIFFGAADFSGGKFLGASGSALSMIGVRFEKDAFFNEAQFEGDVSFEAASFISGVSFESATFSSIRTGAAIKFHRATFDGIVNFEGATCGDRDHPVGADFSFCTVGEKVDAIFTAARFFGPVSFESARLSAVMDFRRVVFHAALRFVDSTVLRRLSFSSTAIAGGVDFSNARASDAIEFKGTAASKARVLGSMKFVNARIEGTLSSQHVSWTGGLDFSQATMSRKVSFEQSQLGASWSKGVNLDGYRINFTRTRLVEGIQFDTTRICSELVMRRLPGTVMLELNDVEISGILPEFDRVQFEDPAEIDRLKWSPGLESVIALTVGTESEEEKRDASRRLRNLAEFADVARDSGNRDRLLSYAHDLAPQALKGSALFRAGSALILGHRRENVGRAAMILAVLALVIFPIVYLAAYKHVRDATALQWRISDLVQDCVEGSGKVGIAAVYTSLRSTLFLIPESEDRSRHAAECLYGKKAELLATSWIALFPILQAGMSGILLFAIGFAVKKRLSYR